MPPRSRTRTLLQSTLLASLTVAALPALADITPSGDVSPANPASWTTSTNAYVGKTVAGSLSVSAGGKLYSYYGYVGYGINVTATATVDGADSSWTNSGWLTLGSDGTGTLNISNAGTVSDGLGATLGSNAKGIGFVFVDGPSTWSNTNGIIVGDNGSGSLTITNGGNVTSAGATFALHGGSGNASIDGPGSTWTATGNSFYIGDSGSGTMSITHGGKVTASTGTHLGYSKGATGTVTVDGIGSTWTTSSGIYIGESGTAILKILNGATVTSSGTAYIADSSTSHATMAIDGTGSAWSISGTIFANSGTATLNITNGGTLTSSSSFTVANSASAAKGTINVDGPTSSWNAHGALYLGENGTGNLNISNGAQVNSSTPSNLVYLGYNSRGTGNLSVDGANSAWTTAGTLYIGYSGTGALSITSAASVHGTSTNYIGFSAKGTVTVDGAGSSWTGGSLYVGYSGNGTLNINGGTVTVAGTTSIAYNSGSTGIINFGPLAGTLNTQSIFASPTQITGTGTINTTGWAADSDLLFDAAHGSKATLTWNNPGQNITVNIDLGGVNPAGDLAVGYQSGGSLTVRDAQSIASAKSYLAYKRASIASASVDGAGSSWTSTGTLYVGYGGSAALAVTSGGTLTSNGAYLAYSSGSSGTITVDGATSSWTNTGALYLGLSGPATLNITGGAQVSSTSTTCNGASTTINFGPNGGALTTQTLVVSPSQLVGSGTINCHGLVSNVDLVFDAAHPAAQSFTWANTGQNVAVNLDVTGNSGPLGDLGAGYVTAGTLTIRDGVTVKSASGLLGNYQSGASGTATVSGPGSTWITNALYIGSSGRGVLTISDAGTVDVATSTYLGGGPGSQATVDGPSSTWTNGNSLWVGYYNSATLNITHQATVRSAYGYLGFAPYSFISATGTATVDGLGSTWTNIGSLTVGYAYGAGVLNITNAGKVTASSVSISGVSLITMTVGDNSLLDLGTGSLSNAGKIQLKAIPNLTPGNYFAITAGTWSGTGSVQSLGGTWDSSGHKFVVAAPTTTAANSPITFDRLLIQRVLITDPLSHVAVEANFMPTTSSSNFTFTASVLTGPQTSSLETLLTPNAALLAGWVFTAPDYTPGDPVFLSLDVGPGYANNLALWHYDTTTLTWAPYAASDLSYDGTYANFTVTGFSGYAVTTLPEPASLAFLALGATGLLARKRR